MKRLHVHVAVENLADSIRFYSSMFANEPTVQKVDYAKWMLDDPRVNFAISQRGAQSGLNHLGIQVESSSELDEMQARLKSLQPDIAKEENVSCCYAKSDKYWVTDPQGIAWETFHTLDTIPVYGDDHIEQTNEAACSVPAQAAKATCCAPTSAKTAVTEKCC
ncbi:glyoxalase/bleomycin resistance/dioxygenase family protein [Collimonas pratensis]|uniref:ArsI/CadI family heavy metal resistance metalloenzyme n=1 Tax=Collimonas pratensis TaxID=279113 RepID=UPI00143D002E|nr:ArsI/CadI family heavy metal resistance metalloenzyme [Collimonas pratensis]NKI72296.1 glyoxalase/bleomycin resistance/dioxygenase family protein [Collimonas pratensis]